MRAAGQPTDAPRASTTEVEGIGTAARGWGGQPVDLARLVKPGEQEAADAAGGDEVEDPSLLRWLKSSAGDVSSKTMLDEVDKLRAVRAFALPPGLSTDVAPKVVAEWRHLALIESPARCRAACAGPKLVL